jgi:hypothetical protein
MSYKVIHYFEDLHDNSYPYNVGDVFPRNGLTVSNERLQELSSRENRQRIPLIKAVEDDFSQYMNAPEGEAEKSYTKTEIARMSKADLVSLAQEVGIETTGKTGTELKMFLVEHFGL